MVSIPDRFRFFAACVALAVAPLLPAAPPDWEALISLSPATESTLRTADLALQDTFTLQGVQGTARRRPASEGGGFDWDDRGPRNDVEWAWFFNRHDYFTPLCQAYLITGDDRYAGFIFATLDDWIVQHPAPGHLSFSPAWRSLEAARRILNSWTLVYLKLGAHPAFTPERRARFLASLHAHGEQLRHHHALYGNHVITEMLALAQLSLVFPPSAESSEWLDYSLRRLRQEFDAQVYPDGAHKELSALYQRVVAAAYLHLSTLLTTAGRTELAASWQPRVNLLLGYFTAVMKPDGTLPLNNDSDTGGAFDLLRSPHVSSLLTADRASRWLPYAGQAVFRSPQAGRAPWAFFDLGPRGTDHDHADFLHLSIALGPRDFLVDNGRYTYKPGPWRDYFAGPAGHNVLLLEGEGSAQGPQQVSRPDSTGRWLVRDGVELAYGDTTFATPARPRAADWRRLLLNLGDQGWLVIDRVVAFEAFDLTTLWHWHPDCVVQPAEAASRAEKLARNGPAALRLSLATPVPGKWTDARGATDPIQGWHSERFNFRTPATCSRYHQRISRPLTNVWLFAPDSPAATPVLHTTFAADGRLVIQVITGAATQELRLDPERPETLAVNKSASTAGAHFKPLE